MISFLPTNLQNSGHLMDNGYCSVLSAFYCVLFVHFLSIKFKKYSYFEVYQNLGIIGNLYGFSNALHRCNDNLVFTRKNQLRIEKLSRWFWLDLRIEEWFGFFLLQKITYIIGKN